jgi:hypothetical protein
MSIFNNANNDKSFNGPQPQLNSSDRTAYLKSKTKYAAAVNLAKNGGVLTKANGARYVGSVQTTRTGLTSASSYSDYLDVAKGKYLLTPPPSSNLAASFQTSSADVYYGNFMVTNYDKANVFMTMLGYPLKTQGYLSYYPNILVKESDSTPSAPTPNMFNQDNIVVDPQFRLFYDLTACGSRNYFQNVTIDPTLDLTFTLALDEVYSLRPEIEQQAQRIIKGEAQRLRSFQFPTRIHFDLDNCDSKASITPVAPDAPVISVSSITPAGPFTVTIAWLQGFDGGRPITAYTVYVDGAVVATLDPQPCRNTHTLTDVGSGSSIWVTASNCLPKEVWNRTTEPSCTTLTSARSNVLVVPVFATVTWSSSVMTMPNEVAQAVHLIIPSEETLAVASGVTMTIRGSVTNNGTFTNAGVIHIYGSLVNNNNGVFTNTGGGTVINYSSNSVTNRGTLTNLGTLTNEIGGVIENKAGGRIDNNEGKFVNRGTFLKSEMSTFNGDITGNAPVLVPAPPVVSPLAWQGKGFVEGAAADKSGQSVSLSSDGSIVAVGAPGANSRRGVVRIYQVTTNNNNNSTEWTLMGSPIEGGENEVSGTSVSLSSDGYIVAVGAPSNGPMAPKGITRIYIWTDGQWTLKGSPIKGAHDGDYSGKSVSLSSDGLTVAIGAPFYEKKINGMYVQCGTTRIYKWDDTNADWKLSWQIDGLTNYEGSGWSVSLSSNGLTVAIGAPIWGNGVTRVYQYQLTNDTWTLMGSVIPGVMVNGASGYSVSLYSNDLITMVAVGAPYANTLKGETRVYQWGKDVSDPERYQWIMLGHLYAQDPIAGLATGENNGYSVSLHSDPDTQTHTVAICAPGASYVKHKSLIYRYHPYSNQSEAMWVAMTKQLHSGEQAESACLSSNGKIAVFGAPNQGITRMYAAT